MTRLVGRRIPGASKRKTSAQTASAFLAMRAGSASTAATDDYCVRCGRRRHRYERGWRWVYPDIAPPYSLAPLAVVCPACPCDDPKRSAREVAP